MNPTFSSYTPVTNNYFCIAAKFRYLLTAIVVFFTGAVCYGWTVTSPYSEADPIFVLPGDVGQFAMELRQEPTELSSMFLGVIDNLTLGWFDFDGSILGEGTSFFLASGMTGQVNVHYAIPSDAAAGIYVVPYEFMRTESNDTVDGRIQVVVVDATANTEPVATIASCGDYEVGIDEVWLDGFLGDAEGGLVDYTWWLDGKLVSAGSIDTPAGGALVAVPPVELVLGLGSYEVSLVTEDDLSDLGEDYCELILQDTTPPTLDPLAEPAVLRPSKKWTPVHIIAQPTDNSGSPVTLDASITFSGFAPARKGSTFTPDAYVDSIDQASGLITLMVVPYGSKKTGFPAFTVNIFATDESGNQSAVSLAIPVGR